MIVSGRPFAAWPRSHDVASRLLLEVIRRPRPPTVSIVHKDGPMAVARTDDPQLVGIDWLCDPSTGLVELRQTGEGRCE